MGSGTLVQEQLAHPRSNQVESRDTETTNYPGPTSVASPVRQHDDFIPLLPDNIISGAAGLKPCMGVSCRMIAGSLIKIQK